MINTKQIITILKENKIAKGCKINCLSNSVTIIYPNHKTMNTNNKANPFTYEGSQKQKDYNFIFSNFSMVNNNGLTKTETNHRTIQITIL